MPDNELRAELGKSVTRITALIADLEAVIAVRSRVPGGRHAKISHSSPPWNAAAAGALLDLHAQVRHLERGLRSELGLPLRSRGGSDGNTAEALQALCKLAVTADDAAVVIVLNSLAAWTRHALITLGRTDPPRRIPRLPGQPELTCPGCGKHTLRSLPLKGVIRCVNPAPHPQGRRPQAAMTWSPVVGDFILVWDDGVAA